jgi:NADH-ubiquinone oxidoreductase chain 1
MLNSFIDLLRWQTNALGLNPINDINLLIMYSFTFSIIIRYLIALLAIAFYTLIERKFLGYFQLRKGPNKVSAIGLAQPLADAIKLFTKEQTKPNIINKIPFIIAPASALILTLLL